MAPIAAGADMNVRTPARESATSCIPGATYRMLTGVGGWPLPLAAQALCQWRGSIKRLRGALGRNAATPQSDAVWSISWQCLQGVHHLIPLTCGVDLMQRGIQVVTQFPHPLMVVVKYGIVLKPALPTH